MDPVLAPLKKVRSTVAQNAFGQLLNDVQTSSVLILNRGNAAMVAMSPEDYIDLCQRARGDVDLGHFEDRFNALVDLMQGDPHRRAVEGVFEASDDDLAQALAAYQERESKGQVY